MLQRVKAPVKDGEICIVSSCGGHLAEVREFRSVYEGYPHFYILNAPVDLDLDMKDRTFFISHAERDLRVLWNFFEIYNVFRRRRPRLILSTGAGPAVPAAIVGLLLGVPTIFVESLCRVTRPSLTGRILYHVAWQMFYQWPGLRRHFPRATFGGPIL